MTTSITSNHYTLEVVIGKHTHVYTNIHVTITKHEEMIASAVEQKTLHASHHNDYDGYNGDELSYRHCQVIFVLASVTSSPPSYVM